MINSLSYIVIQTIKGHSAVINLYTSCLCHAIKYSISWQQTCLIGQEKKKTTYLILKPSVALNKKISFLFTMFKQKMPCASRKILLIRLTFISCKSRSNISLNSHRIWEEKRKVWSLVVYIVDTLISFCITMIQTFVVFGRLTLHQYIIIWV